MLLDPLNACTCMFKFTKQTSYTVIKWGVPYTPCMGSSTNTAVKELMSLITVIVELPTGIVEHFIFYSVNLDGLLGEACMHISMNWVHSHIAVYV